jgi:hypothetical protein
MSLRSSVSAIKLNWAMHVVQCDVSSRICLYVFLILQGDNTHLTHYPQTLSNTVYQQKEVNNLS